MKTLKKLMLVTLSCLSISGMAQTAATLTVLQQPCNGNGELAVNVTAGLTPPLNYYYYNASWSTVAIHSNINSLNDTLFGISSAVAYVYVIDMSGTHYYYGTTTMVPPFSIDPPVITNAICPSLTGSAQLTINGGTAPASVQWFSFAIPAPGPFVTSANPGILAPGQYDALITDASGCFIFTGNDSMASYYVDNISGINFSVATTTASCTNGTAMVSGLTGGMSPYTYAWSNGSTSSSISGLTTGNYDLTVTDAQGCHNTNTGNVPQSITVNANSVSSSATCLQNDGSVITFGSGGTPPYTYSYSNGATTQSVTGLPGNNYIYVTVTDANNCIGDGGAYVGTSTPITVTYTATISSCTAPTGSATLAVAGGTAPYSINWSTFPAVSGYTITSMPAGSYAFNVTDAVGCVRTGTVVIPSANTINASAFATNPVCPAVTGTVNVLVTGTNPPFSYLWNTSATTASLSGVSSGVYSCIVTDNAGCSVTKYASVYPTSPISIGLSTTPASCMYTSDGSAFASPVGGTAPYTYSWSNGQTTSTATGLGSSYYAVTVQDANGCMSSAPYTYVGYNPANTGCYCTITGKVFKDTNGNCIFDSGEQGVENIMIHCSAFGYTFTDGNGDYFFHVPSGSYTLSESVQYAYPLAVCQSNFIPVTVTASAGCVSTVNFANNVTTIHDIHIIRTSMSNAIPGNSYTQGLLVLNDGTVNESNIQLGYRHDGQLPYSSASPAVYTQMAPVAEPNWYSVNSGFPALAAGTSTVVYTAHTVPTNIPIGTSVDFKDTASYISPMSNWLNDYTPWNNVNEYYTTVRSSFDPNFKEVSPQGTGPQGFISTADSSLGYVVHFQNTGSYYADKVVVMDTLDADLDWQSVRPGYSDHSYTASMSETGVLKFTFDHIHLDWESHDVMNSKGLITYSVKQKPNLVPGTQIKNKAAIYFDYNAPVMTNQTLNTIQLAAGIEESAVDANVIVYPNPATAELNVNFESSENVVMISIYDLQGRIIQKEKVNKNATAQKLNISTLVNGLYFIELEKADGNKITKRFIKN